MEIQFLFCPSDTEEANDTVEIDMSSKDRFVHLLNIYLSNVYSMLVPFPGAKNKMVTIILCSQAFQCGG